MTKPKNTPSHIVYQVQDGAQDQAYWHRVGAAWKHSDDKPPRRAYHDKQWGTKMKEIGLYPSSTAQPGGKETGQKVSHYIIEGGAFDRACTAWLEQNPGTLYHDRAGDEETRKKKRASKTKYSCPDCQAAAWGKPELHIVCGDCDIRMEAEPAEED